MIPNVELFNGHTLFSLMEEVHTNSKKKDRQIAKILEKLTGYINDTGTAALLMPLVKDFLDVSVKNDDQLIKLTQLVQRLIASTAPTRNSDSTSIEGMLSETDKKQILDEAKALLSDIKKS